MTKLQYTGGAHFREFTKADFTRHGVEDQGVLKVARHDIFAEQNWKDHPTTVEVSDAAAEFLLKSEPTDWRVVEDDASDEDKSDGEPANPDNPVGDGDPGPNASDAPDGVGLDSPSPSSGRATRSSSTRSR